MDTSIGDEEAYDRKDSLGTNMQSAKAIEADEEDDLFELSAANLSQLEHNALESQTLSRMVLDYYANGSDGQISVKDNRDAFTRYKLLPRMLRDVSDVRPSTNLFGALQQVHS